MGVSKLQDLPAFAELQNDDQFYVKRQLDDGSWVDGRGSLVQILAKAASSDLGDLGQYVGQAQGAAQQASGFATSAGQSAAAAASSAQAANLSAASAASSVGAAAGHVTAASQSSEAASSSAGAAEDYANRAAESASLANKIANGAAAETLPDGGRTIQFYVQQAYSLTQESGRVGVTELGDSVTSPHTLTKEEVDSGVVITKRTSANLVLVVPRDLNTQPMSDGRRSVMIFDVINHNGGAYTTTIQPVGTSGTPIRPSRLSGGLLANSSPAPETRTSHAISIPVPAGNDRKIVIMSIAGYAGTKVGRASTLTGAQIGGVALNGTTQTVAKIGGDTSEGTTDSNTAPDPLNGNIWEVSLGSSATAQTFTATINFDDGVFCYQIYHEVVRDAGARGAVVALSDGSDAQATFSPSISGLTGSTGYAVIGIGIQGAATVPATPVSGFTAATNARTGTASKRDLTAVFGYMPAVDASPLTATVTFPGPTQAKGRWAKLAVVYDAVPPAPIPDVTFLPAGNVVLNPGQSKAFRCLSDGQTVYPV